MSESTKNPAKVVATSLNNVSEAAKAEMERIGGGPWQEDKTFPRRDWRDEVANDDTVLGYFDWLSVKRLEAEDEADQPLASPTGKPIVGRVSKAFAIEYGTCVIRNGKIEFDFSGDEEIDWQSGAVADKKDFLYVDADGGRWEAGQLVGDTGKLNTH